MPDPIYWSGLRTANLDDLSVGTTTNSPAEILFCSDLRPASSSLERFEFHSLLGSLLSLSLSPLAPSLSLPLLFFPVYFSLSKLVFLPPWLNSSLSFTVLYISLVLCFLMSCRASVCGSETFGIHTCLLYLYLLALILARLMVLSCQSNTAVVLFSSQAMLFFSLPLLAHLDRA